MKKRAREESVPLAQIYRQEMTKLYGAPGCEETAVNLPSFQNLKSSLYRSRLQRFPTRAEIDFRGEWTRTAHEEDFLLMDTGQNDQNCLVAFAIVGNLEKLYEAETIYIDGTFKVSPWLFYQLFTVHMLCTVASIFHLSMLCCRTKQP